MRRNDSNIYLIEFVIQFTYTPYLGLEEVIYRYWLEYIKVKFEYAYYFAS